MMNLKDELNAMNIDKKKLELLEKIDNYLSGKLKENERLKFEAAINADQDLENEVRLNRIINEALRNKEIISFKDEINEIRELTNEITKKQQKEVNWRYVIAIAATVLILIASASVFFIIQFNQSSDSLVTAYLEEHHKSPPFFKGPEDTVEDWVINYQKGNYQEAKSALEKIVASSQTNPEAEFYLGLCYLYQEQPDPQSAISQFNSVLDTDNRYREQALWYLGLAYYLADQPKLAAETLEKITGYKQKEAARLLEKMK